MTHISRLASLQRQETGELTDYEAIYRRLVMVDLAKDMELGFFLSYYRNFAIPTIAATLNRSGEIQASPLKRSYDTALVIYEIIAGGFASERSKEMLVLLRRVHQGVPGSNRDFLYVLMTLLVVPIRWTEDNGWRPPAKAEKEAAAVFFHELGIHLGLGDIPGSYAAGEKFLDDYEAEFASPSPEGSQLMDATVQVFRNRLPRLIQPLARDILVVLFDDPRICRALGLKERSPVLDKLIRAAIRARNFRTRRKPLAETSRFTPGSSGSTVYPNGYTLNMLGPTQQIPRTS